MIARRRPLADDGGEGHGPAAVALADHLEARAAGAAMPDALVLGQGDRRGIDAFGPEGAGEGSARGGRAGGEKRYANAIGAQLPAEGSLARRAATGYEERTVAERFDGAGAGVPRSCEGAAGRDARRMKVILDVVGAGAVGERCASSPLSRGRRTRGCEA